MKHSCPICHKTVESSVLKQIKNAHFFPFCYERCKLIDLGKWLDSDYKVVSDFQSQELKIHREKTTSEKGN
jgi:endogenous inhibitor of DNA gyrase (YacG/DUF329 family)